MATKRQKGMSKEDTAIVLGVCKKIHAVGGDPAVRTFLESNGKELPPIKLTEKEMEVLKGGLDAFDTGFLIGLGITVTVAAAVT